MNRRNNDGHEWRVVGLLLFLCAAVLCAHSLAFNFVTDDAFISFVYARNLYEHGALVFNLDERVEGYTNFLWTLILTAGMALRVPPELSSRVLGTLGAALTFFVVAGTARRLRGHDATPSVWDALPALVLAGIPGYACWSSGGLETQLFTLLGTLGATTYLRVHLAAPTEPEATLLGRSGLSLAAPTATEAAPRRRSGLSLAESTEREAVPRRRSGLWLGLVEPAEREATLLGRSGLWLGLAALTRPEGYLLFGLLGLHRLGVKLGAGGALRRLLPTAPELRFALGFLMLAVPHLLWRHSYYGYWVPNTFYIKSSGGLAAWHQGLYYLWAFARDLKLFVLPVLWALGLLRPVSPEVARRYRALGGVTYLWTVAFLLYVLSVGGDFMGLYRFVLPIVPLNVLCGVLGLWRLTGGFKTPAAARPLSRSRERLGEGPDETNAAGPLPSREPSPRPSPASGRGELLVQLGLTALLLSGHAVNSYFVDRHALSFIGADHGIDTPGYLRYYTRDRALIGKWLGQYVQPDDYQVVGGAGAQVYYAGIRALDSFGLSDAYVAHKVPPVATRPGHQKFAPLDYVLSRHPTILTYNVYWILPAPYQPTAAEASLWRGRGFHYVSVQIPGLSQPWYSFLKRTDRRLGPLPKADDLD